MNRRNIKEQKIAINQNADGQTIACTENAFYLTMPFWGDSYKHMLDFIYGLADEQMIFSKKQFLRKEVSKATNLLKIF